MKISLIDPLLVDDKIIESHKEKIEKLGHEFQYFKKSASDDEKIIERLKDSDVAIITNNKFSKNVIENTNLKLIDVAFTGFNHVDIEACNEKNIIVENASGYSDDSVAELVLGLTISLMRKFNENRKNMYEDESFKVIGQIIKGKTVGVVGTGKIGIRVIELFKAFGANILAYSRSEKDEVKNLGAKYVSLDELLKNSDIVTIHLPQNKETCGFIGQNELDLMKDKAILINCARGPIVDNDYLAKLLNEDKLRAGIDVFDMEPPIDKNYPLRNAKNTVLTNHVGFLTQEAMDIRCEIVFDNLYKFLDGKIVNKVN
ncbi:NAD(P)-dependent oxidoreductase [Anaerococcus vaginalis]|uniref:NAD(P)-dependent oxidoreductase n=1 Tax=Anaerococcus vaginalis TaxID=33037 RepID=UPI002910C779|nr:NAD(P)-dependent oxidoreductase [Anaerococcus vaginalis]MDU4447487.1 NAD(P)-dependent oxidoreductase [Anaerococcus vaginalis]MDU5460611.1 NAD(P)-dependent oxidoreductase [Anaerococcus vaginalis]MDU5560017.1 NAD(P)-dependent oxidoreductase [Anaerococcus vaginalis]MDU6546827.1 NAD(P)-dependent oxidoreductase [Anaerococcus vaginalis]MDU7433081.1 NAD(P)-dependent oxidoreductase [Anaerococcus vaginalis]